MQKRNLQKFFILFLAAGSILYGCTKFDTTTIGSDLLPAIDNVKTFGDTLKINTTQSLFPDSTRNTLLDQNALGQITNDPLFGTTKADVFVQLKPSFYPYYFGNANDTLNGFSAGLDSIVLCLSYKGFWGDSTSQIKLDVKEVNDPAFKDSSYKITFSPTTNGTILGTNTIDVRKLKDTVYYNGKNGSSVNVIRIKLNPGNFINQIYPSTLKFSNADSGVGQHYYSDLEYRTKHKGFAILASSISGNGLIMSTSFTDATTKLEVHFKRRNANKLDSVVNSFAISQSINDTSLNTLARQRSAAANNIVRNYTGAAISSPSTDEIFIQGTPGSFANLKIPALDTLPNVIVHRAELVMEQIPYLANPSLDYFFSAPNYLYLDIKDTLANRWKPLYFDLNPNYNYNPDAPYNSFSSGAAYPPQTDFLYHGGFKRSKVDKFGNSIDYYNFNITRYAQQIVTKHTPNYTLRLMAPIQLVYPQLFPFPLNFYNTNIANGRVRLGSGTNLNYKMYVRIIYSKI